MNSLHRTCKECGEGFQPRPMGYNALYCSTRCKSRCRSRYLKPENLTAARKRHYVKVKNNPEMLAKHQGQVRDARAATREWIAQYKLERGCIDCGFKGHFAALQFDHMGIKTLEISRARSSITRLQKEIDDGKCVVRCANCHAQKTWREKAWEKKR